MSEKENLNTFMQFLGYGNPSNKIWFIGIEEGGNIIDYKTFKDELKKRQNNKYLYMENSNQRTQVWDIIFELMKDKKESLTRNNMFKKETSSFFLSNLFPLPKPHTTSKILQEYQPYFGNVILDSQKYLSLTRFERYPIIYEMWKKEFPRLTICFGISYHAEFINLLNLGHSKYESILNGHLYYFEDEKVLLTPFFNRRFINNEILNMIKSYIKQCV